MRTKRNYKNFDEEKGTCEDFSFSSQARQKLNSYNGLQSVTDKILKAVCYVYNKSKSPDFDVDTCKFLYFWLGTTLLSNLNKTDFYSGVIIELYQLLNENNNRRVCNIPHISIQEKDFQKIKLIFDYSQDYYNYNLDLASYNPPCNAEYNKYLTTYVYNYKHLYKECIEQNQRHSYCTEFLKYYNAEKHDHLYSWKCNLTETLPEADPSRGEAENEEQKAQLDVSYGTRVVQEPLEDTDVTVQAHQQIPGPLPPNPIIPENSTDSSTSDGTSSTITSKSITGAVSVAGALVPSYLLYNYTPAGNLINKLLGRTTRMNHNPLIEAELMNNFYQPEGFNSERSGYNISYRPV
ncbi:Plasmodium vivax Vir protein, putative [Plasmodium vivax]|uniref:Vir protein, putative n=1 Tax=Plasmodium vivax TaxID=5855 RepID=A0A1G4EBI8_PLAVI|nr:Plasmodium vivax Vir protein, putative [Plasmodium vivax]